MLKTSSTNAVIAAMLTAAAASSALAGISTFTDDVSRIQDMTNHADFNGLQNGQSLENYQEDGLLLDINRSYFSWNAPGLDGTEMYYADTGSLDLIDISLVTGADFNDIDMELSSGWTPNNIGAMYIWVQLYDDGSLVQEINVDMTAGDYLALTGGGFDQIRIGSYATAGIRDLRDSSQRNAIAIDNISAGTYVPVPTPGTLAVSSIALLGLRRRR